MISGDTDDGFGVYTTEVDVGVPTLVSEVSAAAAFLWSPDGRLLAVTTPGQVLTYAPLALTVYPRVTLFREDGSRHPAQIEGSVVAFFWSPDSTKLAYVSLESPEGLMRWSVLDVVEETQWPLLEFTPSTQQFPVFRYFDQYAHSHSLWSPDSTSLVFAGRITAAGVGASDRQRPVNQIVVLATHRYSLPRIIANGVLGFWSPR